MMQVNCGFGVSGLRVRGAARQTSLPPVAAPLRRWAPFPASLPPPVAGRPILPLSPPKATTDKATSDEETQGKHGKIQMTPKLNAFLLAALPLVTALPAGASEISHYLQLATPGLAVVIGSLAYAVAAPPNVRKKIFTTIPPLENVSLDEILQTEYHPCPGASPVPSKLEELVQEMAAETATENVELPAQTVMAVSGTIPAVSELRTRETDAHGSTFAEEAAILSTQAKELEEGRGRMMLMAFAEQQGRNGSLSQGSTNGSLLDTPALNANGKTKAVEAIQESAEKAKEIVSYVMEWTGLDARESKRAIADGNVQSNVVPLHKGDSAAKELVALSSAIQGANNPRDNGTADGELATVAMVATVPTSAVAALADTPVKSSKQLQEEHKEKIESLMSQVSSIKAVAVSPPSPSKAGEPASSSTSPQKEYDAKVSALKHSAAHKQKEEEARWQQQRTSLESKMNQATKDRLQAVQPYSALAKTNGAQGLAKFHPRALMATFVDTMMAVWRILVNTARRFVGQDPPSPQMQT